MRTANPSLNFYLFTPNGNLYKLLSHDDPYDQGLPSIIAGGFYHDSKANADNKKNKTEWLVRKKLEYYFSNFKNPNTTTRDLKSD